MPVAPLRVEPAAAALAAGFERIREELEIPAAFPPEAEAEARDAARRGPPPDPDRRDRTGLSLVTIDPPGSRDLDQALLIERRGDGHRVRYAIADVAALVRPGGAIDREARARGVTLYLPDHRTPLHPDVLGEGAASLLPGQDRPALLWTIDLDASGEAVAVELERATVRSRAALAYGQVQERIDAGAAADEPFAFLREVGERRLAREAARGGVSLSVPAQAIEAAGSGFRLRYETPLPAERWNAQVSLLTGICAARIMIDGGVGLFRVLAPAEESAVAGLRRSAAALGVPWGPRQSYPDVIRGLDPADPATRPSPCGPRACSGARATGLDPRGGRAPPAHAAIAAPYAHVTAPLRRMADRVANEVVLALSGGREPPAVGARGASGHAGGHEPCGSPGASRGARGARLPRERLLAGRVGEVFDATVVDVRDDRPVVQIAEPAVVGGAGPRGRARASALRVRLAEADPAARRVVVRDGLATGAA